MLICSKTINDSETMHFFDSVKLNREIAVHKVGNKLNEEPMRLAAEPTVLNIELQQTLTKYFLAPFNTEAYFHLFHDAELSLNEVYTFVTKIFENKNSLFDQSVHIATHLYNKSTHPRTKGGELYVVYFDDCVLHGENVSAVGIFKSENKDTFLEIESTEAGYSLDSREGINVNKLDKGCIIFNSEKESGYVVAVVDNTNKGAEAHYWMDEFLGLKTQKNQYHQTNEFLGIAKKFVTQKLTEDFEVSKADQIDLLNKSVDYFKKNGEFDKSDFEEKVFQDDKLISSFRNFDEAYRLENQVELDDNFEISSQAVKKQARSFKSILKLDKNFHIYIHGDRELIERGVDEAGRKYYKIFYKEEN
jgi:hypothetical protein